MSPIQSRDICSLWNLCCHISHANQSALTPYGGERVLPWLDMTICWVGAVGTDKTLEATHSARSGLSLWAERVRKIVLGTTLLYHPLKGGMRYRLHSGLELLPIGVGLNVHCSEKVKIMVSLFVVFFVFNLAQFFINFFPISICSHF